MSEPEAEGPAGQEVLVVDTDRTVLRGLERVLGDAGIQVSTSSDPARARDQIANRFIPIVLCDLDTPHTGAAIDFVKFVREKSPLTKVMVMTSRKSFDAVAPVFRAGAADVIPKEPDAIAYLRDRVLAASADIHAASMREDLLQEVSEVHDEFLKKMMELSRQVTDLEDKVLSRDGSGSTAGAGLGVINVLLVDDEPVLKAVLERDLPADRGWRIRYAQSGGEALDVATQIVPQVLVVKELLPDLTGSMVVKTIKSNAPDAVALLFDPPNDDHSGEVRILEASRLWTPIPSFAQPEQLVGALEQVREALKQKARERRYLQAFRKQHLEFLKKYNAVKQRLAEKPK